MCEKSGAINQILMKRNWILNRIGRVSSRGDFEFICTSVHSRIAFPFQRAPPQLHYHRERKLWKVEKFFLLLGEKCCSSKSRHRLAETLGILDLYVAARFSKITIENNNINIYPWPLKKKIFMLPQGSPELQTKTNTHPIMVCLPLFKLIWQGSLQVDSEIFDIYLWLWSY